MLTGREKELRIFRDAGQDDHSRFIAVYGRRRIGKTFLIREAFGYRFTFQHARISGGSLSEQLYAFEASLREAGREEPGDPHNWLEAFEDLKDLIRGSKETRKVLFIDELSWMDTQNCDLMSALENFWNGWASARKDIVLIVCTSATSWMLNKVIHNKGGLYHRLTDRIPLEPFTLSECEELFRQPAIRNHSERSFPPVKQGAAAAAPCLSVIPSVCRIRRIRALYPDRPISPDRTP